MKVRFSINLHRYSDLSDNSPRALTRTIDVADGDNIDDAAREARDAEFPDSPDGLPYQYADKSYARFWVGARRTVYVVD